MLRNSLLTMMVFCLGQPLAAQESWHALSPFPGTARDDAAAVVCNGKGYMGTGFGTGFVLLNDWWRYDFGSNTWTLRSALPGAARQYAAIATMGTDIYLLGGLTASGCSDELWKYNTLTDAWTLLSLFPGGGRQAPALAAVDGKLYAGLGRCGTQYYSDWWAFDPGKITWKELTSFPSEARFDPVHAVVNEKVLVGAGCSASGARHDCYEYSPLFDAWTVADDYPGCGVFYTAQAADDRFVYCMAGADETYETCPGAYVYEAGYYGAGWQTWNVQAQLPPRRGGSCFLFRNRFYYCCGIDSAGNRLNQVEYVDLYADEKETTNDLVLYPFVADEWICLESGSLLTGEVSIYTASGELVPLHIPALRERYVRFDVSSLASGLYLLRLTDARSGLVQVKRFARR